MSEHNSSNRNKKGKKTASVKLDFTYTDTNSKRRHTLLPRPHSNTK
ncbi:4493_t:CDS:1, partial [Ambispora leptoticha]